MSTKISQSPQVLPVSPQQEAGGVAESGAQASSRPAPVELRGEGHLQRDVSASFGARTSQPTGHLIAPGIRLPSTPAADDGVELTQDEGSLRIDTQELFDTLARRNDVPGAIGAKQVKFLIADVDTPHPKVYFFNTNNYEYHYKFASEVLELPHSLGEFNGETYFTDRRKFIAGSLIAHDNFTHEDGEKGLYSMEFWPTDPVKARHVGLAHDLIAKAMPFAEGKVVYHPSGETQRELFESQKAEFEQLEVPNISTTELFGQMAYSPLNLGEGFGVLRVVDPSDPQPPSVRDVVIFKNIPNDLSHVAGVITEEPQTPLSHINLKAKQNDTPNAYIKDASTDPEIAPLIGKVVHYKVTADGFEIREATAAEAEAHLESVRPPEPQSPRRDLSVTSIHSLDDIGHGDLTAFGAKAANVAELGKILPAGMSPEGFAVPFAFYDQFMKETGLYDEAKEMMADPRFQSDPAVREEKLRRFRRKIRRADVPDGLADQLKAMHEHFPPGTSLRCRSSTNNEDLEGFNGAGLYDSYTHRPDEGHISHSIKQVWSSLWNYRAFEERDFYRIDHFSAAMGVLVHPNFDDEEANGVAVTKNIYDPNWEGYYVNVQVGEALVTNPEAGATPDEMLISAIGPNREFETQYIRSSSLTEDGKRVLTPEQLDQLTHAMRDIQEHFKQVYAAQNDDDFGMDIEFKIDVHGKLVIKQARPWVD